MSIKNLNCRFEDIGLFVTEARLCYDAISEKHKLPPKLAWTIKFVKNTCLKLMMFNSLRSLKKACSALFERAVQFLNALNLINT